LNDDRFEHNPHHKVEICQSPEKPENIFRQAACNPDLPLAPFRSGQTTSWITKSHVTQDQIVEVSASIAFARENCFCYSPFHIRSPGSLLNSYQFYLKVIPDFLLFML